MVEIKGLGEILMIGIGAGMSSRIEGMILTLDLGIEVLCKIKVI